MKERCSRDREMSHPFAVEWHVNHLQPFMIFDRLGTNVLILSPTDRHVKLDRMEDGTELDAVNGGELFEWVWRHPNVCLVA